MPGVHPYMSGHAYEALCHVGPVLDQRDAVSRL